MTTMTRHAPGTFCWTQLGTNDEAGARKFYSGLFGWKDEPTTAAGKPLTLLKKGDKAVGAVVPQAPGQGSSAWTPFVAVTSVDQTAERVRQAGGELLMGPMDVNPNGRFAVFQDPTGAVFAVWQAGTQPGAEIMNETGSVCWNELITTDSKKAGSFYEQVFGWEQNPMPMPAEPERTYTVFKKDATQLGGMMSATPQMHLTHPYWMIYFAVDDCDKTATKAEQLGAKIMMKPTDIPTIGRFAVIRDPQGAWFSILKPEMA